MLHLILLTHSLKLLDSVSLGDLTTHHRLVLLGELLHFGLDLREVVLRNGSTLRRHDIIEETCLDSGTEAELDTGIKFLQCLGKQVGRSVPESFLTLVVVELIELDGSITVDGAVKLCCLTIDPARYNVTGESR